MLVFAAFVPHPLISVPELGKGHTARIRHTLKGFKDLAAELYAAQPHTILVISQHAASVPGLFTVNQQPHLSISFASFGNLTDRLTVANNIGFGYRLKESLETSIPIALTDDNPLDYGTGIALFHMLRQIKPESVHVVSIGTAAVPLPDVYQFGRAIDRQIHLAQERIAVIATGDFAHGASRTSVGGYNPKALSFNKDIKTALEQKDIKTILLLSKARLENVAACGVQPLAALLGIMGERVFRTEIVSYEVALGVGYLTAAFHFS
ncbi:MAG: hypothetical protein HY422_03690 [Candidatus Komeilibacteria bacterium]|nr:hypothetical protein [Candidatus Komeilibacteria bacterium]